MAVACDGCGKDLGVIRVEPPGGKNYCGWDCLPAGTEVVLRNGWLVVKSSQNAPYPLSGLSPDAEYSVLRQNESTPTVTDHA